ncbi:N-(5'-phosphoribosyl)anthranilate isomerase [Salinigranum rubrum]|uniref:N-(5'-phosphoribosyl)anthranilate isomerase n=1 Tax=Salinigranum rubrum TaxID=755307 RepID=A0A2I8VL36_9EURY|nr:phosphoribosylanthranilate isomerase [Salinigranum rubrum]AUV82605.1 N-(5'-phosphoribosyl)anthranilate isomerase [Salinigranum rubrum]
MTRVKVCGVTSEDDLETVVGAGADAVGFIADVPVETPREVDSGTAADLVAAAPPFVTTTLVLMPESPSHAVTLARTIQPDVLQLHCDFDREELQFVRAESSTKVVVTVDASEGDRARGLDDVVDALLVDSTTDEGAGGTGETHDWEATRALAADLDSPVVLAGGLTPENVTEAVRTAAPYGVDVASGVESEGGTKDPAAVRRFVRAVRRVDAEDESEVTA